MMNGFLHRETLLKDLYKMLLKKMWVFNTTEWKMLNERNINWEQKVM